MIDSVLTLSINEIDKRSLQNSFYSAIQALQPISSHFMSRTNVHIAFDITLLGFSVCWNFFLQFFGAWTELRGILRNRISARQSCLTWHRAQRKNNVRRSEFIASTESSFSSGVAVASAGSHAASINCVVRTFFFLHWKSENVHSNFHDGGRLFGLGLVSIENELTRDEKFLDDVVQRFKDQVICEGRARRIALWHYLRYEKFPIEIYLEFLVS